MGSGGACWQGFKVSGFSVFRFQQIREDLSCHLNSRKKKKQGKIRGRRERMKTRGRKRRREIARKKREREQNGRKDEKDIKKREKGRRRNIVYIPMAVAHCLGNH